MWGSELRDYWVGEVTSGRENSKCNNFALFYEEQGLWITVSEEESGSKWDQRQWGLCPSAWEVNGTNFGFYSKCEGKSFEVEGRIVTWSELHLQKYFSCYVYVWLLFSTLALFIALILCSMLCEVSWNSQLQSLSNTFQCHIGFVCRFWWFCSCIQKILYQITFKFSITVLLDLNLEYFQ